MNKLLIALSLSLVSAHGLAKQYILLGSDLGSIEASVKSQGGELLRRMKYKRASVVQLNEGSVEKLKRKFPDLEVHEDIEVHLVGKPGSGPVTQPAQSVPWGISKIKADFAHTYNRGAGVKVCVVDTGIQKNHPDLQANIVGGENFVAIKGTINPAQWDDDNDHGTHVSGTIAALDNSIGVIGVAPQAGLFGVKVLDRRGSGTSSAVADGILSCVNNSAHIISMSLGSSVSSPVIESAIRTASARGIVLVAAAGNESGPVSYPAAYPEVIAVSATDSSNKLAYFSNTGAEVDFAAPGVGVLSTTKGSTYKSFSGTSMAAPHVAGVYALMISSQKLEVRADDIGLGVIEQGDGLVNALRTVTE